jgi:hypothetical protein
MTVYLFQELPQWATKVGKRLDVIAQESVGRMIGGIDVAPGITRGGSRTRGVIPRDLGNLAASLTSSLYGSTSLGGGGDSHVMSLAGFRAGMSITFSWGGGIAPYAGYVHDGTDSTPGTFWIDAAAEKFPGYVAAAVAEAKARFP